MSADKWANLERGLKIRFDACDGLATPNSVLLAVLNSVADANRATCKDSLQVGSSGVLALLDAEINQETEGNFVFPRGRKLASIRAVVAELIAADREYDAAMHSEADTDGMLRREAARARRKAALARVGGAA